MEEIKVGEYIRTKRGKICKVLGVRQEQRVDKRVYGHLAYYLDNYKGSLTQAFIVKHSLNIIDLIEEGDYVNGEIVEKIFNPSFLQWGELPYIITAKNKYEPQEIKDIVTKEQFNQVKYEV